MCLLSETHPPTQTDSDTTLTIQPARKCGRAPNLVECTTRAPSVTLQTQCSRDYQEPRLREWFPFVSLGVKTPYCRAPGPLCSGPGSPIRTPPLAPLASALYQVHSLGRRGRHQFTTVGSLGLRSKSRHWNSTGISKWEEMLTSVSYERFKAKLGRREEECPFRSLRETLLRASKASCPPQCNASMQCCNMPTGHANDIKRLASDDAAQLSLKSAVLRRGRPILPNRSGAMQRLFESAFLASSMGELGIGPKVHAVWMSNRSELHMVTEEHIPLSRLLSQQGSESSPLPGVHTMLQSHVEAVARLGLVLLDFHPGNVILLPREGGELCYRVCSRE